MFKVNFYYIGFIYIILVFSAQSSYQEKPKLGFLPTGEIYKIDHHFDRNSVNISLFTTKFESFEKWKLISAHNLEDVLSAPDTKGFVAVDDSWTLRYFERSKLRTPNYIGKIIFQPEYGSNWVNLLNYHPNRKQLFFSQIHFPTTEERATARQKVEEKYAPKLNKISQKITHAEAMRSELYSRSLQILSEKFDKINKNSGRFFEETQEKVNQLKLDSRKQFELDKVSFVSAHAERKKALETQYEELEKEKGWNSEAFAKHHEILRNLDDEHWKAERERERVFENDVNKRVAEVESLIKEESLAEEQRIKNTWKENTTKITSKVDEISKFLSELNRKKLALQTQLYQLSTLPSLQSEIIAIKPSTGKQYSKILIPNQKITHGEFSANGRYLVVDNRHPQQKHISYIAKIDLENLNIQPIKLSQMTETAFSETVSYKLKVRGESAYMLTYAGRKNENSRILRYHLPTNSFSVSFAPSKDIVDYNISQDGSFAYALLNDFDGKNEISSCTMLNVTNGIFVVNEELTRKISEHLGTRIARKLKFSPQGFQVILNSLDFTNTEAVYRDDILDDTTSKVFYQEPRVSKVPFTVNTFVSKARDDVESHTHLYLPLDKNVTKMPLIVDLHGGPHAHSSYSYGVALAHFLDLGYAIAQVNYRGSTGRGKLFTNLIEGDHGGMEVEDVVEAVENLTKIHSQLDPSNVYIHGESYGAYLTVMLGLRFPKLAKGLIARSGIYDWTQKESSLNSIVNKEKLGIDQKEADLRLSPYKYINRLSAPLLLIHGWKDDICHIAESEKINNQALKLGKSIQFFPLETDHFYRETKIQQKTALRIQEFIEGLRYDSMEPSLHRENIAVTKTTTLEDVFLGDF